MRGARQVIYLVRHHAIKNAGQVFGTSYVPRDEIHAIGDGLKAVDPAHVVNQPKDLRPFAKQK